MWMNNATEFCVKVPARMATLLNFIVAQIDEGPFWRDTATAVQLFVDFELSELCEMAAQSAEEQAMATDDELDDMSIFDMLESMNIQALLDEAANKPYRRAKLMAFSWLLDPRTFIE